MLTRLGFHSNVRKISAELTGNGCSYAVSLPEQELGKALVVLAERSVPTLRVYTEFEDGSLQELQYDLS